MPKTIEMTRTQQSLLLYLEARAVDHCGRVDTKHMNKEDMCLAEFWAKQGLIGFGRLRYKAIMRSVPRPATHWGEFTDEAWRLAAQYRRERADRCRHDPADRTSNTYRAGYRLLATTIGCRAIS